MRHRTICLALGLCLSAMTLPAAALAEVELVPSAATISSSAAPVTVSAKPMKAAVHRAAPDGRSTS